MDTTAIAACALLLLGCGYYIARPLLTLRNASAGSVGVRQLSERKEQLYASILELEFDRELGKLPESDFQRMRSELESQALAIIEQIEQIEEPTARDELEQRIEREIAALLSDDDPSPQPMPQPPASQPSAPAITTKFCGQCGTARRDAADRFCTQCGKAFEEAT